MMRVAIYGHSHVRRWKNSVRECTNQKFPANTIVRFFCRGGLNLHQAHYYKRQEMRRFRPHVIVLMIGDNDVDNFQMGDQVL